MTDRGRDPASPEAAKGPRRVSRVRGAWDFIAQVLSKAEQDDIFFMAGAVAFNLLVAVIPLLFLVVGLAGFFLSARFGEPSAVVVPLILDALPAVRGEFELVETVSRSIDALVDERTGLSLVGGLFFVWISTRLVGTLRIALRDIFEMPDARGLVWGKLFDAVVVVLGGLLVLVNFGVTLGLAEMGRRGVVLFGLEGESLDRIQILSGHGIAFLSIWVLFILIYRYLPARRTAWDTTLVAATFTAVFHELMKLGFSWYATEVADYSSAYGSLTVAAILFFWIYYESIVFILGGEVAQVYALTKRKAGVAEGPPTPREAGKMRTWIVMLPLAALLGAPSAVEAQLFPNDGALAFHTGIQEREVRLDLPLLDEDGPYVVVHLAENRVFVVEGGRALWSAPAGTGHGFRLEGAGQRWTFTTPRGLFKVRRMEKDPLWVPPDWWYVQRDLPVPTSDRERPRIPGTLGTTALYLGDGIAIHGTDRPELLMNPDPEERRVSHGCIRLTDEAARSLYHRVDVGTTVLIF